MGRFAVQARLGRGRKRPRIRAREEAARQAVRPIVWVQALATVCVFVASIALAPTASAWMREVIAAFGATG